MPNPKDKTPEPEPRSGGPREADPTQPPTDVDGETPVHSPDLADNRHTDAASRVIPPGEGNPGVPDMRAMKDEEEILERIRREDKANVLYKWRADERLAKKPRQTIIDALESRLRWVQGPPLSD